MKDLVFIVEDNLVQQKVLQAHFEDVLDDYIVKTFLSPVDLIRHMSKKPFAVVLDHYFGPGANTGLHYLKEMRTRYPSTPVIYHTSFNDIMLRDEVMSLGVEQFILKDTTSLVRLRTTLDTIHNKANVKKHYWRNLFLETFDLS